MLAAFIRRRRRRAIAIILGIDRGLFNVIDKEIVYLFSS
jgi:hypothetical protein